MIVKMMAMVMVMAITMMLVTMMVMMMPMMMVMIMTLRVTIMAGAANDHKEHDVDSGNSASECLNKSFAEGPLKLPNLFRRPKSLRRACTPATSW